MSGMAHQNGVTVNTTLGRASLCADLHAFFMPRKAKSAATETKRFEWAKRLEAARSMTGLSAEAFAKEIGCGGERYRKWERGEREPNILFWQRISARTGVSLDAIISGRPISPLDLKRSA